MFFLKNILMKSRVKDRKSVDFFCEVGSIAEQGVMRIYVESSVKKKYNFIRLSLTVKRAGTYAARVPPQELHRIAVQWAPRPRATH